MTYYAHLLSYPYPPFELFPHFWQHVMLSVSGLRGRATRQRPKAQTELGAFCFARKRAVFPQKADDQTYIAPSFGNT